MRKVLILIILLVCTSGFIIPKTFAGEPFKNISVFDAYHMIKEREVSVILDVRTDVEYAESHIKNAVLIPLMVLDKRLYELKANQSILVYCYSGGRSKTACKYLASKGFKQVYNLQGGINSWIKKGHEVVK